MQVIPYLLLGFPDEDSFLKLLSDSLVNPNFPFVEVGLPSKRPYLDGAVIGSAQRKVRQAGLTFGGALELLWGKVARKIILMGYLQDLREFGVKRFEEKTRHAGFGGMVLVGRWREVLTVGNLLTMPLIPVMTVKDPVRRLEPFLSKKPPFVYFRVGAGKTGTTDLFPLPLIEKRLQTIKRLYPELPVFAGFGVDDVAKARLFKGLGFSGVVVGSALLQKTMENGSIGDFLQELEVV